MSGKSFDEGLENMRELGDLQDEDLEEFCKGVLKLQRRTDLYSTLHKKDIEVLEEKIHSDTYDLEAMRIARLLFQNNYKHLEADLERLTTPKEKAIKKEISILKFEFRLLIFIYHSLQIIAIIGAVIVTFLINSDVPKIIPTIISAVVAGSATMTKYYRFRERVDILKSAYNKLQREYNIYTADRGFYSDLGPGEAFDLFMDTIDELKQEIFQQSTLLEKTIREQESIQDQTSVVPRHIAGKASSN